MWKLGLENREDSRFKKIPDNFRQSRNPSQGSEMIFVITYISQNQKLFDCNLGGRNEACGLRSRCL